MFSVRITVVTLPNIQENIVAVMRKYDEQFQRGLITLMGDGTASHLPLVCILNVVKEEDAGLAETEIKRDLGAMPSVLSVEIAVSEQPPTAYKGKKSRLSDI